MDTSEKYIEMCRKATKLRASHTPCIGDWYFFSGTDPEDMVVCEGEEHEYDMLRPWAGRCDPSNYDNDVKKSVWLPSQEELYELHTPSKSMGHSAYGLARMFGIWLYAHRDYVHKQGFDSIEQHLLAFVMHEKYNKSWDGTEWIGD